MSFSWSCTGASNINIKTGWIAAIRSHYAHAANINIKTGWIAAMRSHYAHAAKINIKTGCIAAIRSHYAHAAGRRYPSARPEQMYQASSCPFDH